MSNEQNSRNAAPAERMLCEQCGKRISWDEYAVNFGLCDSCLTTPMGEAEAERS